MMQTLLAGIIGLLAVGVIALPAAYSDSQTVTIPLYDGLNLEQVETTLIIPEDNKLPWGHIRGAVDNPAEGYPVIIQFYKGQDPVHIAQAEVNSDNTYEYKFRVRDMVDGQPVNVFEGSYTVIISKVVQDSLNSTI